MKTRFRISKNDTVKATLSGNGKLIATLYDSNFTTISEVYGTLCRKVPYFSGQKVECHITIPEKEKSIYFTKKVN
jgi:hypothetical protein